MAWSGLEQIGTHMFFFGQTLSIYQCPWMFTVCSFVPIPSVLEDEINTPSIFDECWWFTIRQRTKLSEKDVYQNVPRIPATSINYQYL